MANRPPLNRVTVIGLGLMGGSLALALRRAGLAAHIVGCGAPAVERGDGDGCHRLRHARTRSSRLGSDYVFLCTPVENSISCWRRLRRICAQARWSAMWAAPRAPLPPRPARSLAPGRRARPARASPGRTRTLRPGARLADLYAGCLWVLTPLAGSRLRRLTLTLLAQQASALRAGGHRRA